VARGRAAARLVHVIGAMGFGMAFGATNGCWIGGDDGLGRWARHLGERPLAGLIDVFVVSWSGCAPSVDHGSGSGLGGGRRTAAALRRMAPLAASSLLFLSPLSRTRRPRPHRDDAPSAFALPQPARTETAGIVRHAGYVVDMAATHVIVCMVLQHRCGTAAAPGRGLRCRSWTAGKHLSLVATTPRSSTPCFGFDHCSLDSWRTRHLWHHPVVLAGRRVLEKARRGACSADGPRCSTLSILPPQSLSETKTSSSREMYTLFGGKNHVEKGGDGLRVEDPHHARTRPATPTARCWRSV
jgi:hypothetical protein